MPKIQISSTGTKDITDGSPSRVSMVTVRIPGFTGSITPQERFSGDAGEPADTALDNIPYWDNKGNSFAAGTAITAPGTYRFNTPGSTLVFNTTSLSSGPLLVKYRPLEGSAATVTSGSGGGGGDTGPYVPTIGTDPTVTYFTPVADVPARGRFGFVQGQVVDGTTAAGVAAVIGGGVDSGGLARSIYSTLLTGTPAGGTTYGIMTASQLFALGTGNTSRGLVSGQGLGDAGSGATALAIAPVQWNGVTFDRHRGNHPYTLLASAARTTTNSTADFTNYNHRGAYFYLNVSAGTGLSLTLSIEAKDPISGAYFAVATATTALTGTGLVVYKVYPGIATQAGLYFNDVLPLTFRGTVTHGNATSATYSLAATPIV